MNQMEVMDKHFDPLLLILEGDLSSSFTTITTTTPPTRNVVISISPPHEARNEEQ